MINIVIPMAGMGSRFAKAGYEKPKPFIDVAGKPMIVRVLENLNVPSAHYYLIARKEHLEVEADLVKDIENNWPVTFIAIDKLTEGTACTVLYARKYINNDKPLLIANSDQIVDCDINAFIAHIIEEKKADGGILTFKDPMMNPKWSFARLDEETKEVVEVKEKEAISDIATVGIYLFSKGSYFVDYAIDMIAENIRVNNEFYTCPVYNHMVTDRKKVFTWDIAMEDMHGIGTPDDLNIYLTKI
ncbi:glycosyltransferase family 2 protein [Rhodanobacter aciditrophus]|uniref:Glycosyltransferase family 2 protein n=1 Tax=Rhodanobacter aciditrophus TaxID=1623218 RepID=A0ABW4AZU9_9GAMM